jgi:hypothetical protein
LTATAMLRSAFLEGMESARCWSRGWIQELIHARQALPALAGATGEGLDIDSGGSLGHAKLNNSRVPAFLDQPYRSPGIPLFLGR